MLSPVKSFLLAIKVVVGMATIFFLYIGILKGYSWYLYHRIKDNQKLYVYDDFSGKSLNAILYIENISDTLKLKEYYSFQKKGIEKPIPFKLRYVPVDRPVFIMGYIDKDSTIIEFVDVETCCWGYIRGYVSKATTHDVPPTTQQLVNYHKFVETLPSQPRYYKQPSNYGIYCDCKQEN